MTSTDTPNDAPTGSDGPVERRASRAGLWMVLLSLVAGIVNYASNLVFGRILSPAEFGDLTALLSLSVVAAVPAYAAQTRVADRLTTYRARGDMKTAAYSIRHNSAHVVFYACVIGVLALLAAPLIEELLSLQAIGPALAVAPLIIAALLSPLALGILQGLERLILLGAFMVAIALARLVIGVIWVDAGGGSGGAILGQAVGVFIAIAVIAKVVWPEQTAAPAGAGRAGIKRKIDAPAVSATAAFVVFSILSSFDIVVAKFVLDPHAAGEYAVLSTIGKIVLFLPSAIAVVMVPRAARRREEGESASRELRIAALLTFLISAAASALSVISPERVVRVMFGEEYIGAADGVLPIVLAGTGLSLIYLLVVYTVAMQDRRWIFLLVVGVVAQVIAIPMCHDPASVATTQALIVWGTLLVNELLFHPLLIAERFALRPGRRTTG